MSSVTSIRRARKLSGDKLPPAVFVHDGRRRPQAVVRLFCCLAYCEVKIAFGIMPWMPLVPSTTWVT
jgi:hypothetical protein